MGGRHPTGRPPCEGDPHVHHRLACPRPHAGFIASKISSGSGQGLILDIVLGIVGAFVGGFLFSFIGAAPVTGFNIYSMIVAIIGAVVVLWLYRLVAGRRTIQ
jgi:uncharacterized membrane protein YeaQ/YmgE (transglycosylase-associated protein family)